MPDAFISYSRKNIAFARLLLDAFEKNDIQAWIDWQDIPPSAIWLAEVYEAIEQSDTFIYIISENSVTSEVCSLEIEHALKNNKRLIPIVVNEVEPSTVPGPLAELNWIFFTQEDQFSSSVADLIAAIQTDQAFLKEHTRLQSRALAWQEKGHPRSELLRGQDLRSAERWLSEASGKEPPQTELQTEYIFASRTEADRQGRIRKIVILAATFIALILSAWAIIQSVQAVRTTQARATAESVAITESVVRATAQADAISEEQFRATAQADLQAQVDVVNLRTSLSSVQNLLMDIEQSPNENLDLGLLLSVNMVRLEDTLESRTTLLHALTMQPYLERFLYRGSGIEIHNIIYDPNGKLLLNSYMDGQILVFDPLHGMLMETIEPPQSIGNIAHSENRKVLLIGMQYNRQGTLGISYAPSKKEWLLWDAISYTPLGNPFSEQVDPEAVIGISSDLAFLATIENGSVGIRERESGNLVATLPQSVEGLSFQPVFSQDETLLLLATDDRMIEVYDVETGRLVKVLDHAPDREAGELYFIGLDELAIDAQNSKILVMDTGKVLIFDLSSGEMIKQFEEDSDNPKDVWDFIPFFGPDGTLFIASSRYVYDTEYEVFDENYHYVEMSGDDDLILSRFSSLSDWSYPTIDAMNAATNPIYEINHNTLQVAAHRSNQGNFEIVLYDPTRIYPILDSFKFGDEEEAGLNRALAAFHPLERDLLALSKCEEVQDGSSCNLAVRRLGNDGVSLLRATLDEVAPVLALGFDPSGERIYAIDSTGTLSAWDWRTEQVTIVAEGLYKGYDRLVFSDDGAYLALSSRRSQAPILVFDLQNELDVSQIDFGWGTSVDFQGEKPVLAMVNGQEAALWDVEEDRLLAELPIISADVYDWVASHPDGRTLATAGEGGVAIWDLETLTLMSLSEIPAFTENGPGFLAYDPTGTWLVSEVGDVIHLHDPQSGARVGTLAPTDLGEIEDALTYDVLPKPAFSSDGGRLGAYALDGQLYFWRLDLESWMAAACEMANRGLTEAEWAAYLSAWPYAQTCP
jgi:WD40 repeat protein